MLDTNALDILLVLHPGLSLCTRLACLCFASNNELPTGDEMCEVCSFLASLCGVVIDCFIDLVGLGIANGGEDGRLCGEVSTSLNGNAVVLVFKLDKDVEALVDGVAAIFRAKPFLLCTRTVTEGVPQSTVANSSECSISKSDSGKEISSDMIMVPDCCYTYVYNIIKEYKQQHYHKNNN